MRVGSNLNETLQEDFEDELGMMSNHIGRKYIRRKHKWRSRHSRAWLSDAFFGRASRSLLPPNRPIKDTRESFFLQIDINK